MKTRWVQAIYKGAVAQGVWYRSTFGYSGSCATLEDWFDRRRTQDDYVPTGFKPYETKAFAVKGYLFRLNPSNKDQESADCISEELIEPECPSRKQR